MFRMCFKVVEKLKILNIVNKSTVEIEKLIEAYDAFYFVDGIIFFKVLKIYFSIFSLLSMHMSII
jgi:hypothetical protein